jgi:Ca2+/Na+ antiporter
VKPLSFVLLFLWLILLLYLLGSTAEGHFCPALAHISDTLRLSPDVAGITILAFGNGSPDVFSIFAGVQQGNFNIALNELTGSGAFVTMCVVSAVALVSKASLERYPFLRDASLYFVAQAGLFGIVFDGKIELWESCCLLVFYFAYVSLVVIVQVVQRRRRRRLGITDDENKLDVGDEDSDDAGPIHADDDGALGWSSSRDIQTLLDTMKRDMDDEVDDELAHSRAIPLTSVSRRGTQSSDSPQSSRRGTQSNGSSQSKRTRAITTNIASSFDNHQHNFDDANDELDDQNDADAVDATIDLDAIKSSLLTDPVATARVVEPAPDVQVRRFRAASVSGGDAAPFSPAGGLLGVADGIRNAASTVASAVAPDRMLAHLKRHRRRRRQVSKEPAVLRRRGIHLDAVRHKVVLGTASPQPKRTQMRKAHSGTSIAEAGESGVPAALTSPLTTSSPSQLRGVAPRDSQIADDGEDDSDIDSDSDSDDSSDSLDDHMNDEPDDNEGVPESHHSARTLSALLGQRAVVARRPWIVRAYRGVRNHARHVTEWREKGRFGRILFVLMSPLHILLWLTVPHVEDGVWHRGVTSVSLVGATCVISMALRLWAVYLGPVPLSVLLIGVSVVLAALFFRFTSKQAPPKYRLPFVLLAFFVSILWIYMTANELVAVLKFFGVAFNISTGILGLTVLAWGNSIGDFVANTVVARSGFPEMAISAAFGGPLFNTVFGLGMAVTYANIVHYPNPLVVEKITNQSLTAFMFLGVGVLTSLIVIPLTKFVIRRWYAGVLITIYIAATTCGLLAEFGVLDYGLGTHME